MVLSESEEPFASEPGLAASLRALPQEQIVSELLQRKDAGIHQALSGFEAQQARGAWINELCEHYYRAHPRAHDAPWPSEKARKSDTKLRDMLRVPYPTGNKIREAASSRLGVQG